MHQALRCFITPNHNFFFQQCARHFHRKSKQFNTFITSFCWTSRCRLVVPLAEFNTSLLYLYFKFLQSFRLPGRYCYEADIPCTIFKFKYKSYTFCRYVIFTLGRSIPIDTGFVLLQFFDVISKI